MYKNIKSGAQCTDEAFAKLPANLKTKYQKEAKAPVKKIVGKPTEVSK